MVWDEIGRRDDINDLGLSQLMMVKNYSKICEGVDLEGDGELNFRMVEASESSLGSKQFEGRIEKELNSFNFKKFNREVSPFGEGREFGGQLKIDIAWEEEKVALELDGPSHFLNRPGGDGSEVSCLILIDCGKC